MSRSAQSASSVPPPPTQALTPTPRIPRTMYSPEAPIPQPPSSAEDSLRHAQAPDGSCIAKFNGAHTSRPTPTLVLDDPFLITQRPTILLQPPICKPTRPLRVPLRLIMVRTLPNLRIYLGLTLISFTNDPILITQRPIFFQPPFCKPIHLSRAPLRLIMVRTLPNSRIHLGLC
ncbi:hypothetical protein BOTBODRAFT_368862 [Botryobasidium botryosum FD-172 SS1]|uniref:Uncharacterized protein n=1 Tax=Botryobasidium botryosum (strain FD-172 SS1) TaxID=930990 RepID=A0A067MNM0_BOTB1|nr:hypothetical protein BOTBODRAFT_368862 [Botryobasidium botryosum FD-172 SS1]